MKEILTSPISKTTARIALITFIIISTLLCFYRLKTYTYLTVEFNDARPVRNKIPVYYKGYRIGKVEKIRPSKDFKTTLVTIVLYPAHIKLPKNTTALLTREKRERKEIDFINILYPEEPSKNILQSGDCINGFATIDIENFLSEKAINGELDVITNNVNNVLESFKATGDALTIFIEILQETINENRPALKIMTNNMAEMSTSLKEFANKLNYSLNEDELKGTFSNLQTTSNKTVTTTENIENITKRIDSMTAEIDKQIPKIDSTLTNADNISKDIAVITHGIKQTLSKRFGGLRLIFGKSVDRKDCNKLRK